ncbi:Down syndrome cell adhesion molecule -like protein [Halotydeus destructor]|nr:Down syndrome cell adhesion molecule -like protein [Halotydeus destructor]
MVNVRMRSVFILYWVLASCSCAVTKAGLRQYRRTVAEAPEIIKQSSNLNVLQEESKLTAMCTLNKGSSPVTFSWMKNGLPIEQDRIKIVNIESLLMTSLTIDKLKSSDAGNYTCKAQNPAGQDSHSLQLIVKQTPRWLKEPQDSHAAIGQHVSVECSANGSPVPTISWFKLNQPESPKTARWELSETE